MIDKQTAKNRVKFLFGFLNGKLSFTDVQDLIYFSMAVEYFGLLSRLYRGR